MQPNTKIRWEVKPGIDTETDRELAGYFPILRQLLYNRGIKTRAEADDFLAARCPSPSGPFLMTGMQAAVERILAAVGQGEKIAVYGDYDADGVTATVLLVEVLQQYKANVSPYIPSRFNEGYGLNNDAIKTLADEGVRLVITVDCGIRSPAEAAFAASLGLDMIITDHHACAPELPVCVANINPRQPSCAYPDKNLAGVGLAYKLAQALLSTAPLEGVQVNQWLDLVALGTIADMAPLTGENRSLVSEGLRVIRLGQRHGIRCLAGAAGRPVDKINAADIGYTLAPRLNAAGRLEHALQAYNLLISQDEFVAGRLAQELDDQNRRRQEQTRQMQAEAELSISADQERAFIAYAGSETFNSGIVGLAASRVLETFYRPAVIAFINTETTRASCRSMPGFDITAALDECVDLLVQHGGHSAAAGFTVRNENRDELLRRLEEIAGRHFELEENQYKVICADKELTLDQFTPETLKAIEVLQPLGMGNPEPLFISRNLRVTNSKLVGREQNHLSLRLAQPGFGYGQAIAFNVSDRLKQPPPVIDAIYSLEKDEWNGTIGIKMRIKDIRKAQG